MVNVKKGKKANLFADEQANDTSNEQRFEVFFCCWQKSWKKIEEVCQD